MYRPSPAEVRWLTLFALPVNPALFRLIMVAEPPQIERFHRRAAQAKQLWIGAVMQHFAGDQRSSERWLPVVAWTSRDEGLTAVRMRVFWARSAEDLAKAERLGYTQKCVMGLDHQTDLRLDSKPRLHRHPIQSLSHA